jgi:hypothetical protein
MKDNLPSSSGLAKLIMSSGNISGRVIEQKDGLQTFRKAVRGELSGTTVKH